MSKKNEFPMNPSTLLNIDESFFEWVQSKHIAAETKEGFKEVPVIWAGAERAFQVKNNKELRDTADTLLLPIISIERTSVEKNPENRGNYYGNAPENTEGADRRGGCIPIKTEIIQAKTAEFANMERKSGRMIYPQRNNKIVYKISSIPMPVYIGVHYKINIKTEYQQQMNDIAAKFMSVGGGINYFTISKNGHRYEGFVQSNFRQENNIVNLGSEARTFQTEIEVKVLGYLLGDDKNDDKPLISVRESAAEFKFTGERSIFGQDEVDTQQALNQIKATRDKWVRDSARATLSSSLATYGTGFMAMDGSRTIQYRTLVANSDKILITYGDGQGANPRIDVDTAKLGMIPVPSSSFASGNFPYFNANGFVQDSGYNASSFGAGIYELTHSQGFDTQYYRGDKTWQNTSSICASNTGIEYVRDSTTTTDETATTCLTLALENNAWYHVKAYVVGKTSNSLQGASYELAATAYCVGGTADIVGSITSIHAAEVDTDWDATFSLASNNLKLDVVGKSGTTINWIGIVSYVKK